MENSTPKAVEFASKNVAGNSETLSKYNVISNDKIWNVSLQKQFIENGN